MCFSATASFATGGALAASAVAITRLPKPKGAVPLALFPAFFAVLQFAEGILWLNHRGFAGEDWKPPALYVFLLIAYVLWPIYVPLSAYLLERGRRRRLIILVCQAAGLVAGITNLVVIFRGPVDAWVVGHSFHYLITMPGAMAAPYVIAVTVPFLVAGLKRLAVLGVVLLGLYGLAALVASGDTFPSVWCFYAAILSVFLYFLFRYGAKRGWTQGGDGGPD
jgi:hypothetical protein